MDHKGHRIMDIVYIIIFNSIFRFVDRSNMGKYDEMTDEPGTFILLMLSTAGKKYYFCLQIFERDIVTIDCVICILFLHNVDYLPAMFYITCVSGIN